MMRSVMCADGATGIAGGGGMRLIVAGFALCLVIGCGGSSKSTTVENPDPPPGNGAHSGDGDGDGDSDNPGSGGALSCDEATAAERAAWLAYVGHSDLDEASEEELLEGFLDPLPTSEDLDGFREVAENQEEGQRTAHLAAIEASEARLAACAQ